MKEKKEKLLTPNDVMKYEIASELGLLDKATQMGWKSLTARESGKIGGLMTKRKRSLQRQGFDVENLKVEEIDLSDC